MHDFLKPLLFLHRFHSTTQHFRCVPFSRLFLPGATTCNPLETDVRFKVQPLSFHLSPPTPLDLALTAFFFLHRLDRQSQQPIHQKTSSYILFLIRIHVSLFTYNTSIDISLTNFNKLQYHLISSYIDLNLILYFII